MKKIIVFTVLSICLIAVAVAGLPQYSNAAEIYGCVANRTGALRIVSDVSQCTSKESPISWSGTGGVDGLSRVIKGKVDLDGTVLNGTGFTVNYDSRVPGGYIITFDRPFTSAPSCVVTPHCDFNFIYTHPESMVCLDHMTDAYLNGGTDGMTVVTEVLQTNSQGQVTTRAAVSLPFSFICAE
jgi:hypothetical protein